MTNETANIIEIFPSVQGEGIYVGQRQLFVRFTGCNLGCNYCDTPIEAQENCKIYDNSGAYREIPNPVSYSTLTEEIGKFDEPVRRRISLTGGEPLLHTEFLLNFLSSFRSRFLHTSIYLETNGTLAENFRQVEPFLDLIDVVAMDIKLESSTGQPMPIDAHVEFIEALDDWGGEYFAKLIVTPDIQKSEIENVKRLLGTAQDEFPLVLQPVSEIGVWQGLMELQDEFLKVITDVRVIPQMHKLVNLR
jgi:organic radical activating enzyme